MLQMDRNRALEALAACQGEVRALGAEALYFYGSAATDKATAASDIDLFIDYDPNCRFNAFDLLEINALLEQRLGA